MPGITYGAGALIAAERGDRRLRALHRRALERGLVPTVPAGVLGQGWRGGPRAQMSRLLKGCRIEPLDEARARSAGAACGRAASADVVDAAVVVGASSRADLLVTSHPDDIGHLAAALGVELRVQTI